MKKAENRRLMTPAFRMLIPILNYESKELTIPINSGSPV